MRQKVYGICEWEAQEMHLVGYLRLEYVVGW
jgi:hypothetical protein